MIKIIHTSRDLTCHDSAKTVEILLGGIKPHDILEQLSRQLLKEDSITLSVDDESVVGDGIAYYKKRDVDLTHSLRIKYSEGLDAGGLSRHSTRMSWCISETK